MEENKTNIDSIDLNVDDFTIPEEEVKVTRKVNKNNVKKEAPVNEPKPLVNCLRNERVIIRHINRPSSITDPRHVNYGRMNENSKKTYVVPRLSSGIFVNVLTNEEKDFLENLLGLEPNALSIYKREDNFWDDSNESGLASVTLFKQDNILNLADPEDYIRYKILLANKDYIAPSYEYYEDHPKATYEYYITSEEAESKEALRSVGNKSKAYLELGTMKDNINKMRVLLEILTGKATSPNTKSEYLQVELSKNIEGNAKEFLRIVSDPLLDTKVLIKECLEAGFISKRGDWYSLKSDNSPLCEAGEDPTLNVAAKYLNAPKHQDILFSLQAKLKA